MTRITGAMAPEVWSLMHPQSKQCAQCGATFQRKPGRSKAQWDRQECCTGACANQRRAQQQRPLVATQARWATAWERQRRIEDRSELRTWRPRVWPHCRLDQRPQARTFVGGHCSACGNAWLYYSKRAQSPYCATCAAVRRQRPGSWRAKQHGAQCEPIIPRKVFERDDWRCQLCGRKTKGEVPALRAPTLDHIVPLACGGDHVYANLQCACYHCNCFVKRDQPMNDQLRLVG